MRKHQFQSTLGMYLFMFLLVSCAEPNYIPCPTLNYPIIENIYSFGIQNMDESAKVDNLTCHYDGFDVKYNISENFMISMEVVNNSNKSLIIDKSKSYVLYNGYSTQLFKDVRSSRSTTFNNVQDAINNVQTNESGVSMTIPPYSKWQLPLQETNVREVKMIPDFNTSVGVHSLTAFDNKETVEFIIPYSYDYSLAKWNTCRNRLYINSVEVKNSYTIYNLFEDERWLSSNQYRIIRRNGEPDYSEANRIDAINMKKYKKHNKAVNASHIFWGIITLPTLIGPFLLWTSLGECNHVPQQCGNVYW